MSKTTIGDFIVKLFSTTADSSTIKLSIDTGQQTTMTTTTNSTGGCGGSTTNDWYYTPSTYDTSAGSGSGQWTMIGGNIQYSGYTNHTFIMSDSTSATTTWTFDQEMLEAYNAFLEEKDLREKFPFLKELWDEYQLAMQLVKDEECDKYFDKKYEGFEK